MSAIRIDSLARWTAPLFVLLLLFLATEPAAAQDGRSRWVYEGGERVLRNVGPSRWAEEIFGRPVRFFDEVRRSRDFVELYTEAPEPAVVRIYPREVIWRLPTDPGWRQGRPGWWAPD